MEAISTYNSANSDKISVDSADLKESVSVEEAKMNDSAVINRNDTNTDSNVQDELHQSFEPGSEKNTNLLTGNVVAQNLIHQMKNGEIEETEPDNKLESQKATELNVVELLLKHTDLDINKKDNLGNTAIMQAVRLDKEDVVDLLLPHPRVKLTVRTLDKEDIALTYTNTKRLIHDIITKGGCDISKIPPELTILRLVTASNSLICTFE